MRTTISQQLDACAAELELVSDAMLANGLPIRGISSASAILSDLAERTERAGSFAAAAGAESLSAILPEVIHRCRLAAGAEHSWTRNKWHDLADLLENWDDVHGCSNGMRTVIATELPVSYDGPRPATVQRLGADAKMWLSQAILDLEKTHDPAGHWGAIGGTEQTERITQVAVYAVERWAAAVDGRPIPPRSMPRERRTRKATP
jgi:hypothetical protein